MSEISAADTAKTKNSKRMLWVARILVFASALGVLISSYFFYDPHYYPIPIYGVNQQVSQAILYGGSLLVLAGFMWLWPGVGSALALLWTFFRLVQDSSISGILPPLPLYFSLYGMFIVGSSLYLITSLLETKAPRTTSGANIRIRWAARILTIVSMIAFAIAFIFITRPTWFLGVLIPVVVLAAVAWIWPVPGGISIIVAGGIALANILPMHYDIDAKMALVIPWLILLAGGALYLILAWREKAARRLRKR